MLHPDNRPEPGSPAPSDVPNVREFPREVEPAAYPTLSRGRKIVLATLLTVTALVLAAAGVSAASNPAAGGGDFVDCATQCPM